MDFIRIDQLRSHTDFGGFTNGDIFPIRMTGFGKTAKVSIADFLSYIITQINVSSGLQQIPYTTAIPFTAATTVISGQKISGATTFTKNLSGAIPGAGASIRLTANGTNVPSFSGMKKMYGDWVSTNDVLNLILFYYDGTDVWYAISQGTTAVAGATQLTQPSFLAAPSGPGIILSWSIVPGAASMELQASLNGVNGWSVIATPSASATSYTHTGLTASTQYFYRLYAKGNGTTTTDSLPALANAVTHATDSSSPSIISAVVENSVPNQIVLTANEALLGFSSGSGHGFSVSGGFTINFVTVIQGENKVRLSLAGSLSAGQVISVSYNHNSVGAIKDLVGNVAPSFSNLSVTNNVAGSSDTTAPVFVPPARIDASDPFNIVIPYNEALLSNSIAWNKFTIMKNGVEYGGNGTETALANGTSVKVGMSDAAIPSDVFTIAYNASGSDVGRIKDTAGNYAASLSAQSVTNNVVGVDADAEAYFDARAAITNGALSSGDQAKWDSFVKGCKSAGMWTDILQVCYLNGTVREAVGINAKTPGTKDVSFTTAAGFTPPDMNFTTTGVEPVASGASGRTGIFPATDLTNNNVYVGFYSRDNNTGPEHYMFGAQETGVGVLKMQSSNTLLYASAGSNNGENATSNKDGFIALNRSSSTDLKVYRNNTVVIDSNTANSGALPNSELFIFKITLDRTPDQITNEGPSIGIYQAPGINKCGFWIVTENMTPTKHSALNTLVQNLMA